MQKNILSIVGCISCPFQTYKTNRDYSCFATYRILGIYQEISFSTSLQIEKRDVIVKKRVLENNLSVFK